MWLNYWNKNHVFISGLFIIFKNISIYDILSQAPKTSPYQTIITTGFKVQLGSRRNTRLDVKEKKRRERKKKWMK